MEGIAETAWISTRDGAIELGGCQNRLDYTVPPPDELVADEERPAEEPVIDSTRIATNICLSSDSQQGSGQNIVADAPTPAQLDIPQGPEH